MCFPMLTSFYDRFLIDFYSQLRPPESQKSSPRCSESTIFQKIAFRNWHRLLIDLGANMAPFCLPKSTKILPKIDPKMHQIFDRFLHRFFSILAPTWDPTWGHVGHMFVQNWARRLATTLSWFSKKVWARFLRFSKRVWARFWKVWGSIFEVSQEGLGSILKVFQEGLVHNVNSMFKHVGHGSGWAGGVTRSVKNCSDSSLEASSSFSCELSIRF